MNLFLEIIVGAIAAGVIIFFTKKKYPLEEFKAYSRYLIIAALVYIVFLFFGSDFRWQMIEVGGLIIYGGIGWFSYEKNLPTLLALGWGLHPVWDWFLHNPIDTPFVPEAYPGLCIGFDLVMALYIFKFVKGQNSSTSVQSKLN